MGDLTTALLVIAMFGWLIDVVLNAINPRNRGKTTRRRAVEQRTCSVDAGHQTCNGLTAGKKTVNASGSSGHDPFFRAFKDSYVFYPSVAAIVMVFLGVFFRSVLVTSGFVGLAVVSRMYQKHIRFPLGIELGVFGAVVCGALFGPLMGALVGLIAYPISIVYTKEEAKYLPVALLGVALVGVIAGVSSINAENIVMWGIGLTIFYDVLTGGLYHYVYRAPILGGVVFGATHIWFNYLVFTWFGESVLNLFM